MFTRQLVTRKLGITCMSVFSSCSDVIQPKLSNFCVSGTPPEEVKEGGADVTKPSRQLPKPIMVCPAHVLAVMLLMDQDHAALCCKFILLHSV